MVHVKKGKKVLLDGDTKKKLKNGGLVRTWEVIGEIGKRATGKEGARKRETALADAKKLICKDDKERKKKRKKEKKEKNKRKKKTLHFSFSFLLVIVSSLLSQLCFHLLEGQMPLEGKKRGRRMERVKHVERPPPPVHNIRDSFILKK